MTLNRRSSQNLSQKFAPPSTKYGTIVLYIAHKPRLLYETPFGAEVMAFIKDVLRHFQSQTDVDTRSHLADTIDVLHQSRPTLVSIASHSQRARTGSPGYAVVQLVRQIYSGFIFIARTDTNEWYIYLTLDNSNLTDWARNISVQGSCRFLHVPPCESRQVDLISTNASSFENSQRNEADAEPPLFGHRTPISVFFVLT